MMYLGLTGHPVLAALLIVFTTSFPFGFMCSVLNQPYLLVRAFFNETYTERRHDGTSPSKMVITVLWSATNAMYIVGTLSGYFLGASLMDKIGRKNVILVGQVFLIAGMTLSTCCVVGKSPEMLIIGRVLLGVLGGIGNSTTPIFLAEITPSKKRGALGVGHQLGMMTGCLAASIVGLPQALATVGRWPYLHLCVAPCAVITFICFPLIPETPRYLYLVVGNKEQARISLVWYRGRTDVDAEIDEMEREKQAHLLEKPFTWKELCDKKLSRPLFIAIMLQLNRQLTGMQAISLYSADIFHVAGIPTDAVPFAVIGLMMIAVIANLIAMPLIDHVGRRTLLISTMSVMVAELNILTVMISIQTTHHWAAAVGVLCVYLHILMTNIGIGPISWVLGAELFEQRARPRAGLAAGVAYSVAFFVVLLAFEPVNDRIHQFVFVVIAAFVVIFLVFAVVMVPETKNKTFTEIAQQMSSGRVLCRSTTIQ